MSTAKVPKHYSRLPGTSMGYKFDCSIIKTNDNPGPGTYELPEISVRTPVGAKFSVSPRFDLPVRTFASPRDDQMLLHLNTEPLLSQSSETISNRHVRLMHKSNSSTFGKASRPDFFPRTQFPQVGPGRYDVKDKAYLGGIAKRNTSSLNLTRKFTIYKNDPEIPGPGTYNLSEAEKLVTSTSSIRFSKSKKDYLDIEQLAKNSPSGDSYYRTALPSVSSTKKGISFGKQKKDPYGKPDSLPGPGHYQLKDFASTPKSTLNLGTFGVSKKESNRYLGSDPGPGDYDPLASISFHSTRRGVSFTKSLTSHFSNVFSTQPGPGNYELPDEFTRKKEEIQKRLKLIKERIEERKRSEGLKALKPFIAESKKNFVQPDSLHSSKIYVTKEDLDNTAPTPPQLKLYRDTVFEDFVDQSSSPGPKYMIEGSIKKDLGKRGTKFFLGKEIERGYIEELVRKKIPGPGAYQQEKVVDKKIPVRFSMSKRAENLFVSKYKKTVPGVGLYENVEDKRPTGGSFGKALKPTAINNNPVKKKFMRLESKLTTLEITTDNIDPTLLDL